MTEKARETEKASRTVLESAFQEQEPTAFVNQGRLRNRAVVSEAEVGAALDAQKRRCGQDLLSADDVGLAAIGQGDGISRPGARFA